MKIIHRRNRIRGAAARWFAQHVGNEDSATPPWAPGETFGALRANVNRLDLETCTGDDFRAAIRGERTSWAALVCDECGSDVERAVEVGRDNDNLNPILCEACARAAFFMIVGANSKP